MKSTAFKHFIQYSQHLAHKLNSSWFLKTRIDQLFQVFLNCLKGITGNTFQCNNDLFIMNRDKLTTNYSHLCQCSGRFMTRFQDQDGPTADLDQCAAQLRRTLTSPWFPKALL